MLVFTLHLLYESINGILKFIHCNGIEKKTHLVFNGGVEEHCGLKPLVRVVTALNPFNCFIAACVQVKNQTTHRTSIHVIHKRQAIFTLHFRAQKPHIIALFALTCFHVCKLSILIPCKKKYSVKQVALAVLNVDVMIGLERSSFIINCSYHQKVLREG